MSDASYDPALVALSIAVAVLASYTALDLGARLHAPRGRRWPWVAGAAVAMGGGIWSMHFIGMLALGMSAAAAYEIRLTVLSFLIAVGVTGAAFAFVSRRGAQPRDVLLSGPLLGLGIAAMHYTGMAAMRIHGSVAHSAPLVAASVVIAVAAATAALAITVRQTNVWQRLGAAVVMGFAVAGMHYTGMAAAVFTPDAGVMPTGGMAVGRQNLALTVAGATFLILFLAMLASSIDQQQGQRLLRASEGRFRAAVEAVGAIIWTNSADGRMLGPQPDWGRFTGQREDEYQDYGWSKAVHPDDVEPTIAAWNASVASRTTFVFEHRVRRADGVYRMCSIRAVPVLRVNGSIREWVGVHEDITERREFEAQLKAARDQAEEANLAKSTFIANMSHELRTPLSAIIGYSEMLLEEIEDGAGDGRLDADMRKIESNARHLLGLINDVLDLSKIESGKMEVFVEPFEVDAIVRDLVAAAESLVARKNNRLEVALAPDLGTIRSDQMKVRQMLLNLLSNAAKFTENGAIRLSAAREATPTGERIVFSVADSGIGMSAEQLAKLFQRFQQADESTTRRFGGTGLGLSLTKAFAEMLGGTVAVTSVLGEGSTFSVSLPVAPVETPAEPDEPVADAGAGLVLVIDDDPNQLALMKRFLKREGFRVKTATDGAAGLALAQRVKPRAILLDVMMPGIDGWSVLSALKADPDLKAVPVVMVTFVDDRAQAAALGAADYLLKPVRWDQIKAVMDRYRPPENAVLVVDDDPDIRSLIRTSLEREGWSVSEAGNGREALDLLARSRPGIVLLDLTMPVMDGFDALAEMRTRPDLADLPVVVLTARDLDRDDRRRLQGADQILNKGDVDVRALGDRLIRLAAQSRAA